MAELTPLSLEAARAELDALVASPQSPPDKSTLLTLHDVLRAASGTVDVTPRELLGQAANIVGRADSETVESLAPRPRVALRLLREGAHDAAWLVVIDNATGAVRRDFRAATSSGADRTEWPLPLLTAVEPPSIYAELPGFRDPRYGVTDEHFEIGSAVRLRCHVDEVASGRHPTISGWAALDHVMTDSDELVALVAAQDGREVRWPGVRVRRADLVGGNRETIRRRAWAGWSVECLPEELAGATGRWSLSVEVTHQGLVRRTRIGKSVGELAVSVVGRRFSERPASRLLSGPGGWVIATG
ncbi:MAG TPA: hypothetical protein VHA79_01325 [Mycobacteriales bacterium]|jgi:hypothetical protein|nr:hypothetical protein [Mycobacteriales bacterium]